MAKRKVGEYAIYTSRSQKIWGKLKEELPESRLGLEIGRNGEHQNSDLVSTLCVYVPTGRGFADRRRKVDSIVLKYLGSRRL